MILPITVAISNSAELRRRLHVSNIDDCSLGAKRDPVVRSDQFVVVTARQEVLPFEDAIVVIASLPLFSWFPQAFCDALEERAFRRRRLLQGLRREAAGLWIAVLALWGMALVRGIGVGPGSDPDRIVLVRVLIGALPFLLLCLIRVRPYTYVRHHDPIVGGALFIGSMCFSYVLQHAAAAYPIATPALSIAVALWLVLAFANISIGWLLVVAMPLNISAVLSIAAHASDDGVAIALCVVLANITGLASRLELDRRAREIFLQHRALDTARALLHVRQAGLLQSLHDKNQLLSYVAHDLRQPVFGMAVHADVVGRELKARSSDKGLAAVRSLQECVAYFQACIDRLGRTAAEPEAAEEIQVEPIDVGQVLDASLAVSAGAASVAGVRLLRSRRGFGAGVTVLSDRSALIEVVGNLLDNGIKYRANGRAGRGSWVTVGAIRLRDVVRIDVVDNGIGISAQHLGRIFESGWRVHDGVGRGNPEGLGLGLASVAKMLKALSGHRIKVVSRLGRGTRFSIYVPCSRRDGRFKGR